MGDQQDYKNFNSMKLMLASPQDIRSWSYGEVKKPETINYRTFKAERDGLFCERIFGPMRDYECNCGRYKYPRHKGVICERCGVEVTEKEVRRERMGHIELAVPIAHIWYMRKPPSRIGMVLNLRRSDVERIAYYAAYIVTDVKDKDVKLGGKKLKPGQLISIEDYQFLKKEYGSDFEAEIGGNALHKLLKDVNVKKIARNIRKKLEVDRGGKGQKRRWRRRLKVIEEFVKSGNEPKDMMLTCVPVIPPDLRPLVPLKGGKFASSDLNDLYRRIINRNNRLKQISEMGAPVVMLHNEKRLLQEAVDALIQNGARGKVVTGTGNRPLKCLSDTIKGKQGRFRRNLLGKRVDYSGRSVIVVGPGLRMNQCGLPKEMAIELYKPFILRDLIKKGLASNLKNARPMLEEKNPVVFDILEEIIKEHPVLLNRAPTLHRLGIQAFEPVLIEGKAIQLHPLVCSAFNADFDGDQMAVHVPISPEACMEAKLIIMSVNNIISPANGNPIVAPTQDIIMGCNYLTKEKKGVNGEGTIFSNREEVEYAISRRAIDLHARIKVGGINKISEEELTKENYRDPDQWKDYTTVGRVVFNSYIPPAMGYINKEITKKVMTSIVEDCFWNLGKFETVELLDRIKTLGYKYATVSDISLAIDDMHVPSDKQKLLARATEKVKKVEDNYNKGVITNVERYNNVIDIWSHVTDRIADSMLKEIREEDVRRYDENAPKFNPIQLMAHSGARGSIDQIRQLAGMRGLMSKPQKTVSGGTGEIIESPIKSNFREGLSVLEYFISTHGGRKGLADTALKTADAGYLTRRLVDVAHNVVIVEPDCGTLNGIRVGVLKEGNEVIENFSERIEGRVSLQSVVDPITDEPIIKEGELITREAAQKIERSEITNIRIRSSLTCESNDGICSKCYGGDLSTGKLAKPGLAVGIIAAQSIGEPGTQLTLRTFHIGGTASRVAQRSAISSRYNGKIIYVGIKSIKNHDGDYINVARKGKIVIRKDGKQVEEFDVRYGAKLYKKPIKKEQDVERGEVIVEWDPFSMPIITEVNGKVRYKDIVDGITAKEEINQATGRGEKVIIPYKSPKLHPQIEIVTSDGKRNAYPLPVDTHLVINEGVTVRVGDILAKIPQEVIKTRDITGGLPRVTELFEARKPKNSAVITEIDGIVRLGIIEKGAFKVTIESESKKGESRTYIIPPGKHLVVYEGDKVYAGEPLTDGPINPHDMLIVKGDKDVQEYLVNEIQGVYRLQGVSVNDKHIEIIIKQMLSFVQIVDSGDTTILEKEIVKKKTVDKINKEMESKGKRPARYNSKLLGIAKASLSSESFISAASFQETTRVLTEAAIAGQVDRLRGLKENVIIGKLIPVGTGMFARAKKGE
ncbi:MAG: DNA-directed RNA polymerase subunit beta' [Elusimicrobia bacterium]|nr:DNA-directed RNA polymerase subunit beta' [Elusimicrobiota bacterium]